MPVTKRKRALTSVYDLKTSKGLDWTDCIFFVFKYKMLLNIDFVCPFQEKFKESKAEAHNADHISAMAGIPKLLLLSSLRTCFILS